MSMHRLPVIALIVRFITLLLMLFVLSMIWWSLSEQEVTLRDIREMIKSGNFERLREPKSASLKPAAPQKEVGDPQVKNLLSPDPYYETTLPRQLGPDFIPHGTYHSAVFGKPENLHPFSNWRIVNNWKGLCAISVAELKFGIYETLSPNHALKVEELSDGKEFIVYLREGVMWQPLAKEWFPEGFTLSEDFLKPHPVTAHDYKFFFDAFSNPAVSELGALALRTAYKDLEAVEVIDDYTFRVKWAKPLYIAKQLTGGLQPLAAFVYKYFQDGNKIVEEDQSSDTYRTNTIWAFNFLNHWAKNIIVGCGPWLFDGMSEKSIRFKRNAEFFHPLKALAEKKEEDIRVSFDTIWQDFKEERLDAYEMTPEQLLELDQFLASRQYELQSSKIKRLDYPSRSYRYIGWNEKKPFFSSRLVRQALTMAIDRERIIRQNLNGQGVMVHGTFLASSPANDPSIQPWPFNPRVAKEILEKEGWFDRDGTGIRSKEIEGKKIPFRFTLTYYVKSPMLKAVSEYVADALKGVGIKVDLKGVDLADISAAMEDKDFDAIFMGWGLGTPPETLSQLWSSVEADKKGSSNFVGFKNAEVDEIIQKLEYENNLETRKALYHRFDAILHEEQPYTFLFSEITTLLYRDWLENVFIPEKRQDLVPGANVTEPILDVAWLRK